MPEVIIETKVVETKVLKMSRQERRALSLLRWPMYTLAGAGLFTIFWAVRWNNSVGGEATLKLFSLGLGFVFISLLYGIVGAMVADRRFSRVVKDAGIDPNTDKWRCEIVD